ncbi:cyclic nucleotide-binding domain-containing protein [Paraburkholderia sp. BR10954]|uniref:cyclic nucleotide-binding domain-containing protein n=1 Tax=Paraburkholderia sp. BR10954 TaxID=3236995 RepID=UPI0034D19ABF
MSTEEERINCSPLMAIDLLKRQKLLCNVDEEVIDEISRHIRYRRFSKREFVVYKGDTDSSLLLLMSGRLQMIALSEDGREVGLDFVEPGDYLGELSISTVVLARLRSLRSRNQWSAFCRGFRPKRCFYSNPSVKEALLQRLWRTIH